MATPEAGAVTLRSSTPADEPFLAALYASTRAEELAVTGWDEAQKARFCRAQFDAQSAHYRQHYAEASAQIVERAGVPAGRLIVARWPREIRIVDLALAPEHRGNGIGTRLLHALQAEAHAAGKVLSIHVERMNPALRLYQRLGFAEVDDKGVYLLMEWRPAQRV